MITVFQNLCEICCALVDDRDDGLGELHPMLLQCLLDRVSRRKKQHKGVPFLCVPDRSREGFSQQSFFEL